MEVQHHINAGFWPRAADLSIQELKGQKYLVGALDFDHAYELAAAYTDAPYVRFINLQSDHELEQFVRDWGPLRLSDREREAGKFMMRVDWSWAFHRRFRSFGRLLASFQSPDRTALQGFLEASEDEIKVRQMERPANSTVFLAGYLGLADKLNYGLDFRLDLAPLDREIAGWLQSADKESIRGATAHLIERTSFVSSPYLKAEQQRRRSVISATLGLSNLEEALEWMIWNGYWMKNRLLFCLECRRAFRPATAHKRKYDTPECAHRATGRKWRRKDLRRKRRASRKGK